MNQAKNVPSALINELIDFVSQSPTPFHVTQNIVSLLCENNFTLLHEGDEWNCEIGKNYVVTRNDSSFIAFTMSDDFTNGIQMLGAHTDSPCLRIKPNADIANLGYLQLGVEVYGGALLHPWMDRDLSIAGRVSGVNKDGSLFHQLIDFKRPIGIIPNLAIHLDREANKNKTINPQNHLPLIISQDDTKTLKSLLLEQCDSECERVLDYELSCYDTQAPSVVGLHNEFLASARLDNLLSTFITAKAMIDNSKNNSIDQATLLISTDHEEVGSSSACGAQGPFLRSVLERIVNKDSLTSVIGQSTLLSCDNAHGIHPNYADKHDQNHGPILNQGPVIKVNSNQRYASNSVSSAKFQQICEKAKVPIQHFVVRSDMGCGSTIGPITATELGIETLDIGAPQWAMHSIRETAGCKDIEYLHTALTAFLEA